MRKHMVLGAILCLLPLAVMLPLYGQLPAELPIHFGIDGQADRYLPKVWAVFGIPVLFVLIQLLQSGKVARRSGGIWRYYLVPGVAWVVTAITLVAALR